MTARPRTRAPGSPLLLVAAVGGGVLHSAGLAFDADAARLVISGFDTSAGKIPKGYLTKYSTDTATRHSFATWQYVASPSVQGNGALLVNYSVGWESGPWGAAVGINHFLDGDSAYNLEGCTHLSFSHNVVQKPQLAEAQLVFVLSDSSDCQAGCGPDVAADFKDRLENFYSFYQILGASPGWHQLSTELRGDDKDAPFLYKGWSGTKNGDRILDKRAVKGFAFQFGLDPTFAKQGDVISGAILLDGLECTGPRVLESAFAPSSWEAALDRGTWLPLKSGDGNTSLEATWSFVNVSTPPTGEVENIAALWGDISLVHSGDASSSSASAALDAGRRISFAAGHFLPSIAHYNLTESDEFAIWFQPSTASVDFRITLHSIVTASTRPAVRGAAHWDAHSPHFDWVRFPKHDLAGDGDSEVWDVASIDTIKRRVEELGLRMFSVRDGRAFIKSCRTPATCGDLRFMGNDSSVVSFILAPGLEGNAKVSLQAATSDRSLRLVRMDFAEGPTASGFDKFVVKGFELEISVNSSNATSAERSGGGLVAGSVLWGGACAPQRRPGSTTTLAPSHTEFFILEEGLILNLWGEVAPRLFNWVASVEDCAAKCQQEPGCAYFAFRQPRDQGNCAGSPHVSGQNVFPRELDQIPAERRKNRQLWLLDLQGYSAGWIPSRRASACGNSTHAGACTCSSSSRARASCGSPDLHILPLFDASWSGTLRELSLAGSQVTVLTRRLLGAMPVLEALHLGAAVDFLEPGILTNEAHHLVDLTSTAGPSNILRGTGVSRYDDVCCSEGQAIPVGSADWRPCHIEPFRHGIDCSKIDDLAYLDQRSEMHVLTRDDAYYGWGTNSANDCCAACQALFGCSFWTYEHRAGNPPFCHLRSEGGNVSSSPKERDSSGGPGYVSGWTPLERATNGNVSLSVGGLLQPVTLGTRISGERGYTFEYTLAAAGLITRGAVWITPTLSPSLQGVRIDPAQVHFIGGGDSARSVRFSVSAGDAAGAIGHTTAVKLKHSVTACDEAWNFLSNSSSSSMTISILPRCRTGLRLLPGGGSDSVQVCQVPLAYYAACAGCVLLLSSGMALFLHLLGRKVPIKDIRSAGGSVRLATPSPHRIRNTAQVVLTGTGHFDGQYSARYLGHGELELLDKDQKPLARPIDTSVGYLLHKFPGQFVDVTTLRVQPWLVILVLLSTAGVLIALPQLNLRSNHVGVAPMAVLGAIFALSLLIASISAALGSQMRRRCVPPVITSVNNYRKRLLDKGWAAQACPRGPHRAIMAGKMADMHEYFMEYIGTRNMYYINDNIVEPLTEAHQLSFAEVVGPSMVQWFISHYWGSPFQEFATAVYSHATQFAQNSGEEGWKDVAYWICSFSVNQWSVEEEVGDGHWRGSSFFLALMCPECKGTMMVMDPSAQPLRRSWCLFELLHTFELQTDNEQFEFVLGTANGVLNHGGVTDINLTLHIGQTIAELDVKDAQASHEADKAMIDELVIERGGFGKMNSFIRDKIGEVLHVARDHVEDNFARLDDMLSGSFPPTPGARTEDPCSMPSAEAGQEGGEDRRGPASATGGGHPRLLGRGLSRFQGRMHESLLERNHAKTPRRLRWPGDQEAEGDLEAGRGAGAASGHLGA